MSSLQRSTRAAGVRENQQNTLYTVRVNIVRLHKNSKPICNLRSRIYFANKIGVLVSKF
jgi:hypothetical protein